jgi:hypothetical protein
MKILYSKKRLKLLLAWILILFFIAYGLLPISMTFTTFDFSEPNTLEIVYQQCGCPCAEALIIKGELQFSECIRQKFPDLQENKKEITLTNLPLFKSITAGKYTILTDNTFKVTGQVIGVDTIFCDPSNCEIIPKFQVSKWKTTLYDPRFWLFNDVTFVIYLSSIVLLLPIMTIITIITFKKRSIRK